jgi:transposase
VLKDRVRELRPAYLPPDPASRTAYAAGEVGQCDLWFPAITLPVGFGQTRSASRLPVLVMVTGYARWLAARLLPSRAAEDLFAAGGSSSKGSARCRGCWCGTGRARSASVVGGGRC